MFKRALSFMISGIMLISFCPNAVNAAFEDEMVDVLSAENATFQIVSSAGMVDAKDALDRDYVTEESVSGYNGIPIYDINGKEGEDYIMLMTIASEIAVPMNKLKMVCSPETKAYLNQTTTIDLQGVEIYVSDSGADGTWQLVHSEDSLEGKLQEEVLEKRLWSGSGATRTFYEFDFDKDVTGKYVRIAVREVEPWLGSLSIYEIFAYAKTEQIPADYSKLNINIPDNATHTVSGKERFGTSYAKTGSEISVHITPDSVSQIASVTLNGEELTGDAGTYTFIVPEKEATVDVACEIKNEENVKLKLQTTEVAGGSITPAGTVPVITFTFNNRVGDINKDMILVNGKRDSGLVQHAFCDASDKTKVYVVPFSDKLEKGKTYTVALGNEVKSMAGMELAGATEATFTLSEDYAAPGGISGGYIKGYGDGIFGPENDITVNEALIIANRIAGDNDYSSVNASDYAATRLELAEIIYIVKYGQALAAKDDMFTALVKDGIFRGYEDGSFRRENKVTRAEAVTLFNRATNAEAVDEAEGAIFTDVPKEYWAAADIESAAMDANSMEISWLQDVPEVEYDVYNEKGNVWTQVPVVSQEQRDMGISGGEGGQWMQSIECDDIDGQLLFAGVDIAGLVRSTDGGKTWHKSFRGFMAQGTTDIDIDANNKNRVLAIGSVSDSTYTGIYLSTDMGETWRQVFAFRFDGQRDTRAQLCWDESSYDETIGGSRVAYWSTPWDVTKGESMEFLSGTDYFTHNTPGLIKTEDGGEHWSVVNEEMSDSVVKVHPTKGYVYVGNENGFFRSEDGGKTFTQIISGEPIYGLDVIRTRPDYVYLNDSTGVLISDDCGKTFTKIVGEGFPSVDGSSVGVTEITRDLAVSPANPDYMLVDRRAWRNYRNARYYSHDGGKTWSECSYDDSKDFFFNHNRQHPFAWHPTDENKVWSLGGDWVCSSSNGGETFMWDAEGYCGTPPGGRINFYAYNTDIIYGSVQDLMGVLSTDGGYTWTALESEGGAGFCYGSFSPDGKLLVTGRASGWYTPRSINVSRDGGKTWTDTGLPLKNGTARRATSFWGSVTEPKTIFVGEYVSRDNADSWTEMTGCEMVMAQNYYHNKEIYGLNKIDDVEYIVVSFDCGRNWLPFAVTLLDDEMARGAETTIYTSGSGMHTWDIEYDGVNDKLYYLPGTIYTAKNLMCIENNVQKQLGQNVQKQELGNGGTYQLIALDPRYPDVLYLGGYQGDRHGQCSVQRSCDGGETFQIISSMGDPKSIVKDGDSTGAGVETLVVNPANGVLWAWTCTDGFWTFPAPYENN